MNIFLQRSVWAVVGFISKKQIKQKRYPNMNSDESRKSMAELDGWIEQLMDCKQMSENQVRLDKYRI